MTYEITDKFWSNYRELVRREMIPYQWSVLNDEADIVIERERDDEGIPNEKSHAMENFRIAAGRTKGEHYGWVFQDSDVYKWLEAVAYSLKNHPDEELKKKADGVIDLIAEAQCEDGYVNTYFTIKCPKKRFKRLCESHELYCAGHYIEAAVAYHEAVGNTKALDIAIRMADCIDASFGPEEGKIHGYDGHEEVEIGLMKLYHATGADRYKKLAEYFLRERGQDPDFFRKQNEIDKESIFGGSFSAPDSYFQNHLPVTEQMTAEGHAVRLVYLATALADLAATDQSEDLKEAARNIWSNIVNKRMYITGGIGSTVIGESFTLDYDLPNDTMYCETCASIGLMFYARQMLRIDSKSEYADVMERALYNTVISGMALDGKHFFYVNPLEVDPVKDRKDSTKSHVKPVRPAWLGCACCPPNLARLISSLENYIYTFKDEGILVNLFIDSTVSEQYGNGTVTVTQKTDYPVTGKVIIKVGYSIDEKINLMIRIPFWADKYTLKINGSDGEYAVKNGYAVFGGLKDGDEISFDVEMAVKRYYSNNNVSENIGKVAFARGPVIYCAEGVDNGEGLHLLSIPSDSDIRFLTESPIGNFGMIEADGYRIRRDDTAAPLYYAEGEKSRLSGRENVKIKLIPYHVWANRGENEMRVWINESR